MGLGSFALLDVVERAKTGQLVKEIEFESKLLPTKLKELVAKYDIKRDPEVLVPSDDELTDNVFKAAYGIDIGTGSLLS